MSKFSKIQIALAKGEERIFEYDHYQPIEEPEMRPPDARLCKICHGMGFYKLDVPVTDERFGKAVKCTHPDCKAAEYNRKLRQAALENAYSYNDAGENYDQYTFATWLDLPMIKQKGKVLPYVAAKRIAQNPFEVFTLADLLDGAGERFKLFPANEDSDNPDDWQERLVLAKDQSVVQNTVGNWIVFESGYGMGKTGLAVAGLNEARANGYYTVFVRLPDYIEAWQRTYNYTDANERADAQRQLSAPLEAADLLLVDEVNVAEDSGGRASPDKIRIFTDYIIQPRWSAGTKKPTILTTNKPQESFIKHWGDRLATRVFERAHWLRFGGVALRHQNKAING